MLDTFQFRIFRISNVLSIDQNVSLKTFFFRAATGQIGPRQPHCWGY